MPWDSTKQTQCRRRVANCNYTVSRAGGIWIGIRMDMKDGCTFDNGALSVLTLCGSGWEVCVATQLTARDVKFSEAISSMHDFCRAYGTWGTKWVLVTKSRLSEMISTFFLCPFIRSTKRCLLGSHALKCLTACHTLHVVVPFPVRSGRRQLGHILGGTGRSY